MDEKNFTESAIDILESINIPDAAREMMNATFETIKEQIGLNEDDKFDMINNGTKNTPSLFISTKNGNIDIGTMNVNLDGNLSFGYADNAIEKYQANLQAEKGTLDFIEKHLDPEEKAPSKEEVRDSLKQDPQLEKALKEPEVLEDKVSTKEILEKSFEKNGFDLNNLPKHMQKMLKDAEKADKQMLGLKDRHEKVIEYKSAKKELNNLNKELKQELGIAKMNGCEERTINNINDLSNKITVATQNAIEAKEAIPPLIDSTMKSFGDTGLKSKEVIVKGFNKIKAGFDAKIHAGFNALKGIKKSVEKANDQMMAHKDTAFTNLDSQVSQIGRNWMAASYAIDNNIAKSYDKLHENLERIYSRTAEIKGAVKNVGRAFTGKEQEPVSVEYTPSQQKILDTLERNSNNIKAEMASLAQDFEISKSATLQNIKGAKEHRAGTGLNFSNSLEKNIQNVNKLANNSSIGKAAKAMAKTTEKAQSDPVR